MGPAVSAVPALQRARMSRRCGHCRLQTECRVPEFSSSMLHRLPIQTLGDIARYGLVLRVRCQRCGKVQRLEVSSDLNSRRFGRQRFRCRNVLGDGTVCLGYGSPTLAEPEQRRIDASLEAALFFLFCERCVPGWQILAIDASRPPWDIISSWPPGDRFRCPACRGRVEWHVHGRPHRPGN